MHGFFAVRMLKIVTTLHKSINIRLAKLLYASKLGFYSIGIYATENIYYALYIR